MFIKLRFLFVSVIFFSFFVILNLFSMESVGATEAAKRLTVEFSCSGDSNVISAVARIKTGVFDRSVYLNVFKNLKTKKFTTVMYKRGYTGVLLKSQEMPYPEIEEDLKNKIAEYERARLDNKVN